MNSTHFPIPKRLRRLVAQSDVRCEATGWRQRKHNSSWSAGVPGRAKTSGKYPATGGIVVLLALSLVIATGFAPAAVGAQELAQEAPPDLFCGEVTINGEPAGSGVEVTAMLDGQEYGPQVTDSSGQYAGCNIGAEKLEVNPNSQPDDTTITFYVDGVQAQESATYEGSGDVKTLDLTVQTDEAQLQSIDITLDQSTIKESGSTGATVMANYDDGTSEEVTSQADISSGDPSVATFSESTISGESPGTVDITAEYEGETDSASLTVEEVQLQSIDLSLDSSTIDEESSTSATVDASFDDGSTQDVTADASISSADTGVASVSGSTIVGEGPGQVDITAEYGGETETVSLTVEEVLDVVDLEISLAEGTIKERRSTTASVTAIYEDDSTQDVTGQADISSADLTTATVSGSTIFGQSPGETSISAEFEGESAQASLTVEELVIEELELTFEDSLITANESTTATVMASFEDGSTEEVTGEATIASQNTDIAGVSDATIEGIAAGEATITAEFDGETATATLTVSSVDVESISLSLDESTIGDVDSTGVTVMAQLSDGSTQDLTDQAAITTSDATVATVDGGTVLGQGPGEVTVTAEVGTASDSATLTVEATPVESLDLSVDAESVEEGESTGLSVTATYVDGATADVTDEVGLSPSNASVVTVEGGTITGETPGDTDVTVEYRGESASTTLTVQAVEIPTPFFEVGDVEVEVQPEVNDEIEVVVEVVNTGDTVGSTTVEYEFVDRSREETVEVGTNETVTVTFTATIPDSVGQFEHIVNTANDTGAATTTVVESVGEDDVGDEPEEDGGDTSIFVLILLPFVLIVIVIAAGYWLIRRESG